MFLVPLASIEFPIQISAPSRPPPASVLVIITALILYTFCRSTLHQGLVSSLVKEQELRANSGSLFPSTALPASEPDDWTAILFSAAFWSRRPYRSVKISIRQETHDSSSVTNTLPSSIPGASMMEMPKERC